MKRIIYLFIILAAAMLTGCEKKDQMTNFIPSQIPEQEDLVVEEDKDITEAAPTDAAVDTEDDAEDDADAEPTKPVHIGQTTTKYVKLSSDGDKLNVRATPSTEKEPVGFLVHTEMIEVIEIVDGWASFLYKGEICYVKASYLVDERPAYIAPPTPTKAPTKTPTPTPTSDADSAPPEI